jgi:hypothetical protein
MLGISIRKDIGLGDKLQFSSLPENYFRAHGKKLIDVSKPWLFDHNPFVIRGEEPSKVRELWNFPQIEPWANPRLFPTDPAVYTSNAEVTAARFGVKTILNRPRLYRFEEYPFESRCLILLHTHGKSNGTMPDHVIDHVIKKYKPTGMLFHIGFPTDPDIGIPKIETPDFWALAEVISRAKMFIGVDSGPSWIAACYPDVVAKKVRLRMPDGQKELADWVPLEINSYHAHWDDRNFLICNPTEDDVGFTSSYKRL